MSYLDMSALFVYNTPFSHSKAAQLLNNDNFLKSRSMPDSTSIVFFQAAAPTGYTQDVSNNGKALRVVSGNGGGIGGTTDISTTITLAHTHPLSTSGTHDHDGTPHAHSVDTSSVNVNVGLPSRILVKDGTRIKSMSFSASGSAENVISNKTENVSTGVYAAAGDHDHGGATDSQLANVSMMYTDVIVATKDANSFTFANSFSFFYNKKIDDNEFSDVGDSLNENDEYLEEALIPATTKCVFPQSATPIGWTIGSPNVGSSLRVVSGAGAGTGGSKDISETITIVHEHSTSSAGNHSHTMINHSHGVKKIVSTNTNSSLFGDGYLPDVNGNLKRYDSGATPRNTITDSTKSDGGGGTTGDSGNHVHPTNSFGADISFNFINCIQATKDAGGAPHSFVDQTTQLGFERLVSKQKLNQMGKNDEYVKFHQVPTGTKMLFPQAAAPSGWNKLTLIDDAFPRMVVLLGGQFGGTDGVAATMTLAHPHTLGATGTGEHTITHSHEFETSSENVGAELSQFVLPVDLGEGLLLGVFSSGGTPANAAENTFSALLAGLDSTGDSSNDHGGTVNSSLNDVSIAYEDVILCEKI